MIYGWENIIVKRVIKSALQRAVVFSKPTWLRLVIQLL